MNLLSNSTLQFIITTSISLLLGGISVWLAMRRPAQIPLFYETLSQQRVEPSNDEVKVLLARVHISSDDSRVQCLHFVTFKLHNSGKETVTITEEEPLSIAYQEGTTILACEAIKTDPKDLDYKMQLEDERLLLVCPLLDPKESITLKLLIAGFIDHFPSAISLRVPGSKRIVMANNTRSSKEMLIIGLVYLCLFGLSCIPAPGTSMSELFLFGLWSMFLPGILFLFAGWMERKARPIHMSLPSDMLKEFIKALPMTIPFIGVFVLIYYWFGKMTFAYSLLIVVSLAAIFFLWIIPYEWLTAFLNRKKKKYNPILIRILASMPLFIFICMLVRAFSILVLHW